MFIKKQKVAVQVTVDFLLFIRRKRPMVALVPEVLRRLNCTVIGIGLHWLLGLTRKQIASRNAVVPQQPVPFALIAMLSSAGELAGNRTPYQALRPRLQVSSPYLSEPQ